MGLPCIILKNTSLAIVCHSQLKRYPLVKYDPKILQKYAEILYRDARTVVFIITATFVVIGLLGGYGLGREFAANNVAPENRSMGTWLIAGILAFVAGLVGFFIGQAIAFWYRLRAQTMLCQKQIEYNTRLVAQAMQNNKPQEIVP
jgi:hypothetical protein